MTVLTDHQIRERLEVLTFDNEGGKVENYVHTHYRCDYDPESNMIDAEHVCINQDGACFGIGLYAKLKLKDGEKVNWHLNWTDIEA